jgi:hypothetical protein
VENVGEMVTPWTNVAPDAVFAEDSIIQTPTESNCRQSHESVPRKQKRDDWGTGEVIFVSTRPRMKGEWRRRLRSYGFQYVAYGFQYGTTLRHLNFCSARKGKNRKGRKHVGEIGFRSTPP